MIRVDEGKLLEFENRLNPAYPEKSGIAPQILGYGEISTTFCLESMPDVAFKRMPPFLSPQAISAYRSALEAYCRRLRSACGIDVSEYAVHEMHNRYGEYIVYVSQPRLAASTVGHRRIRNADDAGVRQMTKTISKRMIRVHRFNMRHAPEESIGIDGQISNWGFPDPAAEPVYIDITTPMLRTNGRECIDPEIFLKSCPPYLVWLVRWQFLQEVLDRYHDIRQVLIDLAANLYKEGCGDRVPMVIETINDSLEKTGAGREISALTQKEVRQYYQNDAFIWSLFLALRRFDRFVKTRLLGRRYNFILPGPISR